MQAMFMPTLPIESFSMIANHRSQACLREQKQATSASVLPKNGRIGSRRLAVLSQRL
jgi:hypothetical protein